MMLCPRCHKKRSGVYETRHAEDGTVYRKHICRECAYIMYTAEFEVEPTDDFAKEWQRLTRTRIAYKARMRTR